MTDTEGRLDRDQLATVARELLLCGHLIDRVTMPHLLGAWGREVMRDVAIDEWMGASPIYTRRTQALLGIEGDDVAAIFKGMQFDIGAPPQFMDFRYTVHDAHHGEFHLDHCGALMDVEPMGPELVTTMCHDIEDPTFDATAWATNPRARMRPVHRPPREPADRQPHCAWTVTIDPDAPALAQPTPTARLQRTRAAQLPLADHRSGDTDADGGAEDYAGPLVADVDLAGFSAGLLSALGEEIALQHHLLALSCLLTVEERFGVDAARNIGRRQLIGAAGISAERLAAALGLGSSDGDLATLFALHPLFRPRGYVDLRLEATPEGLLVDLGDSPALAESPGLSWPGLLVADDPTPLAVIARALDRTATVDQVTTRPGAVASYAVTAGGAATDRHPDVAVAYFSTGAEFNFATPGTRVSLRSRRDRPGGR